MVGVDPARREQVRVRQLVPAVLEVAGLDPALLHERLQAVIGLAQTDPHRFG